MDKGPAAIGHHGKEYPVNENIKDRKRHAHEGEFQEPQSLALLFGVLDDQDVACRAEHGKVSGYKRLDARAIV